MKRLLWSSIITATAVIIGIFIILASFELNIKLLDQDGIGTGFNILLFEISDNIKYSDIPFNTVSYTVLGTSIIVIPLTIYTMGIISRKNLWINK